MTRPSIILTDAFGTRRQIPNGEPQPTEPHRYGTYTIDGQTKVTIYVHRIDEENKTVTGQLIRQMPRDTFAVVIPVDGPGANSHFTTTSRDLDAIGNIVPNGPLTIFEGQWKVEVDGITLHFQ